MCKVIHVVPFILYNICITHIISFSLNPNKTILHNKQIHFDDELIKFPSHIDYNSENIQTLPTNEDSLYSKIFNKISDHSDSDKKIQEINEAIKDGSIIDHETKEKLFQKEGEDEEKEVEEKEVSLGSSGENYKKGVDSTAEELNDISRKLESDGLDSNNSDDIELRDNLLNKIMKSQHQYVFGA